MNTSGKEWDAPTVRQSDRETVEVFVEGQGLTQRNICTESYRWFATVQEAGKGFEAVVKRVNVEALARMLNATGPRTAPKPMVDRDECERVAKARAKKLIRLYCKQIGVDHLLTLTTREDENTSDDMLKRFRRFVQLYRQACGGYWEYVAVLEEHPEARKQGRCHLHIHVACVGKINVQLARKIWIAILGGGSGKDSPGNVDAKHIKCGGANPLGVTYKIASYISKYVTKDAAVAFNKKRYWASRVKLEEARRYQLSARTLEEAMAEFSDRFGIEAKRGGGVVGMFCFPYRDGFWIEVVPELCEWELPF